MFDRIVLAIDGSEPSHRAEETAATLAGLAGSEVIVLHVRELEPMGRAGPISLERPSEAANLVTRVVAELQAHGVNARGQAFAAISGHIAPQIIETAKTENADLIVLGTRGLSDFTALLVGSVAHKVIHHAHCPVLVTR